MVLEITFQIRSANAMILAGIKNALDSHLISAGIGGFCLLRGPVLHHHGDGGSAATIFFLPDEWNIQPNTGGGLDKNYAAETDDAKKSLRQMLDHEEFLAYCHNNQYKY